jgi:hypothetical protein
MDDGRWTIAYHTVEAQRPQRLLEIGKALTNTQDSSRFTFHVSRYRPSSIVHRPYLLISHTQSTHPTAGI